MLRYASSLIALVALFASIAACDGGEKTAATKLAPLRAGAGEALIELPVGHSKAGYLQSEVLAYRFPENDPGSPFADLFPASRGIQSAPKAKAVLLDNGVTLLAIAKIDAIFTTDVVTARAVALARGQLGLDLSGRLILSATHTHDAGCRFATSMEVTLLTGEVGWRRDAVGHGVDSFNPESAERVAQSIVNAIAAASADMRPAALGYARGESPDGGSDRRCVDDGLYGADNIDRAVRLIRIDEVDEADNSVGPIALLVNHAMHGTIYGADNQHISVDAPGYVEYKLEERFDRKVSVLYMQGTAGDVSPGGTGRGAQRMEDVGYRVADTAYGLYRAVTGAADASGVMPLSREIPIRLKSRRIPITHALVGYEESEFYPDGAMLCMASVNQTCPDPGVDAQPASTAGSLCITKALEGKGKYHTDLLAAQVGPLTLVTLPGEAVSEVGRQVLASAAELGLGETLLYAYAQDHNGYILMPDDWLRGGYEPTISYWGWKFAPYLLAQTADLLRELKTGEARAKRRAPRVVLPDMAFEPVAAAVAKRPPAIAVDAPEAVTRTGSVAVEWIGGDPVHGLPRVSVERREGSSYAPLTHNGWRPVDNYGYQIVTEYQADPSHSTAPTATVRDHLWRAVWGVPVWAPAGQYRLRVTGTTLKAAGAPEAYDLKTADFTVTPSLLTSRAECDADGDGRVDTTGDYFRVITDPAGVRVVLTAFYPQAAPLWDEAFTGGDDQIANWWSWSERGTPDFPISAPLEGSLRVLDSADQQVGSVTLTWRDVGGTAKIEAYCPGDDHVPHADGQFEWPAPGSYRLEIEAGKVTDVFGNAVSPVMTEPIEIP